MSAFAERPIGRAADVLNSLLALFKDPHYLEIGVDSGVTFFAIEAARKVAVDPKFRFSVDERQSEHRNAQFHEVESDVYFGQIIGKNDRFDVIYLDGLHTADQTLRDFCNAIEYLNDDGVIVIDDIAPTFYHTSLPDRTMANQVRDAIGSASGADWMGDVYRLVFFIQSFFQQYRYATVMLGKYGQLVVWKEKRQPNLLVPRGIGAVGMLPFEKTITEVGAYNKLPFPTILELIWRNRTRNAASSDQDGGPAQQASAPMPRYQPPRERGRLKRAMKSFRVSVIRPIARWATRLTSRKDGLGRDAGE